MNGVFTKYGNTRNMEVFTKFVDKTLWEIIARDYVQGVISLKILDYIPSQAEIGVGLALRLRTEEYIFFLPGKRHANNTLANEMFYAGVGGHLEPGEDLLECGKREALEEIGLEVKYESSNNTFYIDDNKNIRLIKIEEVVKPLAIFEMIHPDGSPRAGEIYHIIIFKAFVDVEPQYFQETEVAGVIIMSKEQVMSGKRRATIKDYINEGARVLGSNINTDTILYPIGTAEALTYINEG